VPSKSKANQTVASFISFCSNSWAVHPLYEKADRLSHLVIGAAIEVHRYKGSGLLESIYERCLLRELELRSIPAETQRIVRVEYKGLVFEPVLRDGISRMILPGANFTEGNDDSEVFF
jgi:hypothetical protein